MFDFSKLAVLAPVFVALVIAALKGRKAMKASPMGPDEKEIVSECLKALVYVFAAGILVWWILPPIGGAWTIIGLVLSSILGICIILCVVDLPSPRMDRTHDFLWREWRKTPVYSKSGEKVQYIRWARRFAMLLFALYVLIALISLSGGGAQAQSADSAQRGSDKTTSAPQAPATSAPSTSAAPQATATAPATSAPSTTALKPVDNTCYTADGKNGPQQIPAVDSPSTIKFGTNNLKVCYSGQWRNWSDVTSVKAPSTMQLVAWVQDGSYGYMGLIDTQTGDPYVIRTTDF